MCERSFPVECPGYGGHPKMIPVSDYEKVEKLRKKVRKAFEIDFDFVLTCNGADLDPEYQIHEVLPKEQNMSIRVRRLSSCSSEAQALIEKPKGCVLRPVTPPRRGKNLPTTSKPSEPEHNYSHEGLLVKAESIGKNGERLISSRTEDRFNHVPPRSSTKLSLPRVILPNKRNRTDRTDKGVSTPSHLPQNLKSPRDKNNMNSGQSNQRITLKNEKTTTMAHDEYGSDFESDEIEDESDTKNVSMSGIDDNRTLYPDKNTLDKGHSINDIRLNWDTRSSNNHFNGANMKGEQRRLSMTNQCISESQRTTNETNGDVHRRSCNKNAAINDHLLIQIQSLNRPYDLTVSSDTTIEQLINILWDEIDITIEHCIKKSHVLLLFTHRMHIFMSDPEERVDHFLKLTPTKPHFYMYALNYPNQYNEMYTYETKPTHMFAVDPNWWTPICFVGDTQLPRPQSVLLSSLYALRLFFRGPNDEQKMLQQAMEAQFFLHIRKYLFPPAVLALKHAMEGALFWFEKPLIVDSLIKLLVALCPVNISRHEVCDCIPLLFCWIFEQCSPTATESDHFQTVKLRNLENPGDPYIEDPATSIDGHPEDGPLILTEMSAIRSRAKRHVDIRSLTKYTYNRINYYGITYFQSDDYTIYDPPNHARLVDYTRIPRFTDDQIKELYGIMAKKYPSFTLVTRGALSSDVHDQLVLMQDRTIALLLQRKANDRRTTSNTPNGPNSTMHLFELFNPLQHTVGHRHFINANDLYQVNTAGNRDTTLPAHIYLNLETEISADSICDFRANTPVQQITVVLLDRSRSMFDKSVLFDSNHTRTLIDMSIIMLGILSDNIVSGQRAHAFGLIHFGESVEEICPITRSRDRFERALTVSPMQQEWTNMYDAVNRAITLIITYIRDPRSRVAANCKKLVICISDGVENHSSITINQLKDRIKQHDIIIDFVSFLRDSMVEGKDRNRIEEFKQLCQETHGYIYHNLPVSDIELGATFEQEAALWICERQPKKYGIVEKPVRRMPAQLYHKATNKVPTRFSQDIQGAPYYNRVLREINNVFAAKLKYITIFVCRDDIFFWKIILQGPFGTPYEGGHWMLYIHFSDQYPRQPPSVRFLTEIYHVNVSGDGKVCHHIFDRGWSNTTTMLEVFESIFDLLKEPNFDDAVSTEKAQLKRDNPEKYFHQAKQCTQRHAKESVQQLKKNFDLED